MGANITPTMKNRGRTVFGVKMGLSQCQPQSVAEPVLPTHCHAFKRCCRNAVSMIPSVSRPYAPNFSSAQRLLGGLRLFVFFGSSRAGSWLDIESACSTCSVRDIFVVPRNSALPWVVESCCRCSRRDVADDAAERLRFERSPKLVHAPQLTHPHYGPRRDPEPLLWVSSLLEQSRRHLPVFHCLP